jgi:hypothetical protein
MKTLLDVYITFPTDSETDKSFEKLYKYFGCVENVEEAFDIEFSCGDGKYYSDFHYNWDDYEAAYGSNEENDVSKYDGCVCLKSPPRMRSTGQILKIDKLYHFTVKYSEKNDEEVQYLNSIEISRIYTYSKKFTYRKTLP